MVMVTKTPILTPISTGVMTAFRLLGRSVASGINTGRSYADEWDDAYNLVPYFLSKTDFPDAGKMLLLTT